MFNPHNKHVCTCLAAEAQEIARGRNRKRIRTLERNILQLCGSFSENANPLLLSFLISNMSLFQQHNLVHDLIMKMLVTQPPTVTKQEDGCKAENVVSDLLKK